MVKVLCRHQRIVSPAIFDISVIPYPYHGSVINVEIVGEERNDEENGYDQSSMDHVLLLKIHCYDGSGVGSPFDYWPYA
jgi:hypothetical protein